MIFTTRRGHFLIATCLVVYYTSMFLSILKKYTIIENKQTDGASLRQKNIAWEKISQEFNTSPVAIQPATIKQLKRLWTNLKQKQRNALTKEKQYRLGTGGGPCVKDADIDTDINEIAPALIVGIDDAIDSDATFTSTAEGIVSENIADSQIVVELDSELYCSTSSQIFPLPSHTSSNPPLPNTTTQYTSVSNISTQSLTQSILPLPNTSTRSLTHSIPPVHNTPTRSHTQSIHPPPNTPARSLTQSIPPVPNTLTQSLNSPGPSLEATRALNRNEQSLSTKQKSIYLSIYLEKEYQDRKERQNEVHNVQMRILHEQLREAKAKADLAELLLEQQRRKGQD